MRTKPGGSSRALGGAALVLAAVTLASLTSPALPAHAAGLEVPDRGEPLFARGCAVCHGRAGEGGRGPALAVPRLLRATDEDSLVKVILGGIEGTEMPKGRLTDAEARQVAAFVLRLGQRPRETVPGEAGRGERLYSGKGGCAVCHAIQGRGGAFGPDLTDIGRRRGAAHLRQSLTDPEADVPKSFSSYRNDVNLTENFLQVRLVTLDGQRLLGVRTNEDTFSIQLRDAGGRLHSFFKDELRELNKDWGKSPMPAYGRVFSRQELDDVVAFLLSLRSE